MSEPVHSLSHIVLAFNDGEKKNRLFYDAGFTIVHSLEELLQLDLGTKRSLLIQVGLNWFSNQESEATLYDGYNLLLELLKRELLFKGSIGMISCTLEENIYNAANTRIFPLIKRLPFEYAHICEERGDWDKKLLMQHYHCKYEKLSNEFKKGFLQVNTGAVTKTFQVEHQQGTTKVIARKNKLGEYVIHKTGFSRWFRKIGTSKTEHGIIDELTRYFFPVYQLSSEA